MFYFRAIISLIILGLIKVLSRIFYDVHTVWLKPPKSDPWQDVRIICFLNHTSLYEPLFLGGMPWRIMWRAASRLIAPAADITIKRPIVGRFFKILCPGLIPITRKRDTTWTYFMDHIHKDSLIVILPEGRMKRKTGLDKHGNPMTVRGGIADILEMVDSGKMVIAYSLGLHHVQAPGEPIPRLFKRIQLNLERVDIKEFKDLVNHRDGKDFKHKVVDELQERMDKNCPTKTNKAGSLRQKE